MPTDKIGPPVVSPVRDEIAYWLMVLAKIAHNCFSIFSYISPNSERAVTAMEIVAEKDGIRFKTVRKYNRKILTVGNSFFMRRIDLERALQRLEEEKNEP